MAAFTDEDIRAIVQVAQYSDPRAERWIADCLIERRNRIGRTYFATVLPLDDIAVRGAELTFVDLAVQHQYAAPRRYRVDWLTYDNKAGKPSAVLGSTSAGQPIPAEAATAPVGSYVLARITAEGVRSGHGRAACTCAASRMDFASSASIVSGPAARWSIRASSCGRSETGTSSSTPSGSDSSTPTLAG